MTRFPFPSSEQIEAVLAEHVTSVRVGSQNEANFVVHCPCGQKIGVASLGEHAAVRAGRRHVAQVISDLAADLRANAGV